ncbi:MAG: sigma-70 family RNA polymerase sigma factor [bacterium]|nr:sigma-70 family RNA polymerase sigma factor [bacterium]
MDSNSLEVLRASFDLPILTREQEIALFQQFQAGGPNTQAAREKIFLHNTRLVVRVAKKILPNMELEDKFQWGIIGLDRAIDHFNLEKGCKFSTYAPHWIKQAISREGGRYSSFGFSLPTHLLDDLRRLIRIVNREGIEPTFGLVVNHPEMTRTIKGKRVKLGIAQAARLVELYTKHRHPASLEQESVASNGTMSGQLVGFLADEQAEPAFDQVINNQIVISLLDCLSTQQLQVVTLFFLNDDQSVSLISRRIGASAQTVRNILAASLALMRRKADELGIEFP